MLITNSPCSQDCALALRKAIGEPVKLTHSMQAAIRALREAEYNAVIVDENLMESSPLSSEAIMQHAGTAVPVEVNFAITSMERIVRETRAALRRQAEQLLAMKTVAAVLRSELNSAITGILLSSELALSVPVLPPAAQIKIKFVYELAKSMRQQLETAA